MGSIINSYDQLTWLTCVISDHYLLWLKKVSLWNTFTEEIDFIRAIQSDCWILRGM